MGSDLSVTIHIDGGSRGNPGPAGAGVVLRDGQGAILYQAGLYLGRATNNVAEYRGLLAGLKAAADLKASQVRVVSDSELLVRQMNGQYRVKNEGLKPLYEQAKQLAGGFSRCAFQHVRRELNKEADHLVNQAIDARRNVDDAQQ
jgi:ribonuclease HI